MAENLTDAFVSNFEKGLPPLPREDAALHRGFSALTDEEIARAYIARFDGPRRRGEPPRWNVLVEFELSREQGHVLAATGREGHFTVWGHGFSVHRVIPI